jgi:glycosyltransferase involved in cell wall biosynthesis
MTAALTGAGPVEAARPLVTIAMPCLDEARFIEGCLRSVRAQTYPADRLEVLVADGGSTDGTRDILARLAGEDPRIRVVDNPPRIQAAGLNRIIRASRGAVIVRMDVHAEYAPDYVERCVEVLGRTGADNVGGAQRCAAQTPFQKAVCAALGSPLGMGGAAYRDPSREGFVDTVFLGAFRRDVFDRIGLYDEGAVTNEDAEFNQRLVQAGGRIYLSRDIHVSYFPRETFPTLARQYYRYGFGRARTLLKHGRVLKLRPVLPFLALVSGGVLLLVSPSWAIVAVAFYALVTLLEAVRVGRGLSPAGIATAWLVFPVLQLSQAVGFGMGLAAQAGRIGHRDPDRLPRG